MTHDYLHELSHDDWFHLVNEYAELRENASPSLQRLIREEIYPIIKRTQQERKALIS